jgi:hypothetical protein
VPILSISLICLCGCGCNCIVRYKKSSRLRKCTSAEKSLIKAFLEDYASSLGYYATALEIFHEYNDKYRLEITKENLAVLMKIKDWDASAAIAQLEINVETKKALQSLLEEVKKEK